jgi:hypothetical protein
MGFVKDQDLKVAAALLDVDGEERELDEDWDRIVMDI